MFEFFNPNPKGKKVGDCTIRALCKALNKDWEQVYIGLSLEGYNMADMPSANFVWGRYLLQHGFQRFIVDDGGNPAYSVKDFCADHPTGIYVLGIYGHVVTIVNGIYYDTWDCGDEIPVFYWVR